MPLKTKFSTKGMEETLEQLAQHGRDVDRAVASGLAAGGQVLLDGMQRRVPRDTENLAHNLTMDGPHQDGNYHYVTIGLNKGVDAETARYGAAQEYGWGPDHPGQPYIRPAVDEDTSKARRAMLNTLKHELEGGQ